MTEKKDHSDSPYGQTFSLHAQHLSSSKYFGSLAECFSWPTALVSKQQRFWRDCIDAQGHVNLRCSHMQ